MFIVGGYIYWAMFPRWRLAIDTISSKLIYFVKGEDGGGGGDIVALQGDRGPQEQEV